MSHWHWLTCIIFAAAVLPLRAEEIEANEAKADLSVALVNLPRIFKECTAFVASMAVFKERVEETERQLKLKKADIDTTQALINQTDLGEQELLKGLQEKLARLSVEFSTETTKTKEQFLREEAQLYARTYDDIRAEIARLCKERGIRLVLRSNVGDKESNDRSEIMQRVNRNVVYEDGLDIAHEIIAAINKTKPKGGAAVENKEPKTEEK